MQSREMQSKIRLTSDIFQNMEGRRKLKIKNNEVCRQLNNEFKNEIREPKYVRLGEKWDEIEEFEENNDNFNLHRNVKKAVGTQIKVSTRQILNEDNNVIIDKERNWNKVNCNGERSQAGYISV